MKIKLTYRIRNVFQFLKIIMCIEWYWIDSFNVDSQHRAKTKAKTLIN